MVQAHVLSPREEQVVGQRPLPVAPVVELLDERFEVGLEAIQVEHPTDLLEVNVFELDRRPDADAPKSVVVLLQAEAESDWLASDDEERVDEFDGFGHVVVLFDNNFMVYDDKSAIFSKSSQIPRGYRETGYIWAKIVFREMVWEFGNYSRKRESFKDF